ncbi:unnamed protein product, partial [Musa hybrid cultivar]
GGHAEGVGSHACPPFICNCFPTAESSSKQVSSRSSRSLFSCPSGNSHAADGTNCNGDRATGNWWSFFVPKACCSTSGNNQGPPVRNCPWRKDWFLWFFGQEEPKLL